MIFSRGEAGVNQRDEVGAAAHFFDGIGRLLIAVISDGHESDGHDAARGKAHDAETTRVDFQIGRVLAEKPHCARRVGKIEKRVDGFAVALGGGRDGAVFQDGGGDTDGIEPVRDLDAFLVDAHVAKSTAGDDEHGGIGGGVARRGVNGERGIADETDVAIEATRLVAILGGFGLLVFETGCAFLPEGDFRLCENACS
ncbi:MAG: hypothetical protein QM760_11580 [Nibricoccus sp.]